MNRRKIVASSLLLVFMVAITGGLISDAYAATDAAEQTGLGSVFKKREATGVGPTKTQFAITVGATVVMIAVVKFL